MSGRACRDTHGRAIVELSSRQIYPRVMYLVSVERKE
jgi:hypothetical protein